MDINVLMHILDVNEEELVGVALSKYSDDEKQKILDCAEVLSNKQPDTYPNSDQLNGLRIALGLRETEIANAIISLNIPSGSIRTAFTKDGGWRAPAACILINRLLLYIVSKYPADEQKKILEDSERFAEWSRTCRPGLYPRIRQKSLDILHQIDNIENICGPYTPRKYRRRKIYG